jgi:hypothetical protein
MLASIALTIFLHVLRYIFIIQVENATATLVLDWLILIVYSIVSFIFIPLFVTIMTLLEITNPEVYDHIKCRLIAVFTVLMLFLIIRLYLYADIKFIGFFFREITIYSVIPFYSTEVIIALSLVYVLYATGEMDKDGSHDSVSFMERTENMLLLRHDDNGEMVVVTSNEIKDRIL